MHKAAVQSPEFSLKVKRSRNPKALNPETVHKAKKVSYERLVVYKTNYKGLQVIT